jgi:hypothetical protein
MHRKFFFRASCGLVSIWLSGSNIDDCFRSTTEEMLTCPGDQDQYQVRPHDDALEQTADSQEKAADVVAPEVALMKPSTSSKKKAMEQEFVLVSSSDGPSGPSNHVSPKTFNLRFTYLTISSPRG